MRNRVTIVEKSIRYNGHYEVEDGVVKIASAYGSPSGPAGKDPKVAAEALLRKAVQEWRP